jgi:hypothetical protein
LRDADAFAAAEKKPRDVFVYLITEGKPHAFGTMALQARADS